MRMFVQCPVHTHSCAAMGFHIVGRDNPCDGAAKSEPWFFVDDKDGIMHVLVKKVLLTTESL